ncbi:MAG: circadian clock-controlled protein [Clostridium butyricum]|jgi:hypothetical protein|uniref:circadian clock-controlled protein n=1 Tax=Clostridium TaxID=1485 RepID=UPI0028FE9159|nr:circadian clock-controlled protein [Clostridium sp.]MDU1114598.1 circadian clock-controlled protein [Clostridium sp.]MDU7713040.1 circadian clock-controlled protein [Clostridium butyricum]
MARITISFKNTSKDSKLYEYWNNIEDRSSEIKKVLQKEFDKKFSNLNREDKSGVDNSNKNEVDVFNF